MLHNQKRILLLAIVFAIAFAFSKDALAGSYQTIDSIPNGGAVALYIPREIKGLPRRRPSLRGTQQRPWTPFAAASYQTLPAEH